jgi:hypothetical protein
MSKNTNHRNSNGVHNTPNQETNNVIEMKPAGISAETEKVGEKIDELSASLEEGQAANNHEPVSMPRNSKPNLLRRGWNATKRGAGRVASGAKAAGHAARRVVNSPTVRAVAKDVGQVLLFAAMGFAWGAGERAGNERVRRRYRAA